MRFGLILSLLVLVPLGIAGALMAQGPIDPMQTALTEAKAKALEAERRSELLRQEASNATSTVDRIIAQRAVLSAEIAAAEAQIDAANARIAIISQRQRTQRLRLGQESEPVLRLNAALQQMTSRPTALMIAQPGQREDYIHLRAVMATVQPEIIRRTGELRQQIAVQGELRAQELAALKSLGDARTRLESRRTALARLEGDARFRTGELSADAAMEFEQAIAQGERARDIVGRIDNQRLSNEKADELAALDGPMLVADSVARRGIAGGAYMLPAEGRIVTGFHELNATGYRERGIRVSVPPGTPVVAPAAGKISFAGRYRSYGQIVIIEHGGGWNSLITHLDAVQVSNGALVTQGAVLGTSGNAAADIGVELRRKGRVMDIAALLG